MNTARLNPGIPLLLNGVTKRLATTPFLTSWICIFPAASLWRW